jgi:hypothetical protein
MNFINCLLDASDALLDWDISETGFADAITTQACLMAGLDLDDISDSG